MLSTTCDFPETAHPGFPCQHFALAETVKGNLVRFERVRFDNRGVPWGAFDWITGDRIRSF